MVLTELLIKLKDHSCNVACDEFFILSGHFTTRAAGKMISFSAMRTAEFFFFNGPASEIYLNCTYAGKRSFHSNLRTRYCIE